MHTEDLKQRVLQDGNLVRVHSASGEVTVEVKASDAVMPGVVCLPHGFGHQREGLHMQQAEKILGASYNDLTSNIELDGPSGNAALNGLHVWVEAVR
jgi:anaerobic selenocysteine-containing dehydrogenase